MIIQCDNCKTRFRLDDSRITPSGVRVRCTRCQNVFIVTPPPAVDEVQVEEIFGVAGPEDKGGAAQPERKAPGGSNLKFDFESAAGKEAEAAAGKEEEERPKSVFDDMDFSFAFDRGAKEEGATAPPPAEKKAGEAPVAEARHGEEKEGAIKFPPEEGGEVEAPQKEGTERKEPFEGLRFGFGEPRAEAGGVEKKGPTEERKEPPAGEAGVEKPGKRVISFVDVADREEGLSGLFEEEKGGRKKEDFSDVFARTISKEDVFSTEEGGEEEEGMAETKARKKSPAVGIAVAILIVVLGGGLLYLSGVVDMITRAFMPSSGEVAAQAIEIEALRGYFVDNRNFGRFFVIEARIRNMTEEPKEVKGVKGAIYDPAGNVFADRMVSPGRVASNEDLRGLEKDELLRRFRDPSGATIPPRGTVPVMVPFTEIPPQMSEYGLDVIR